MSHERKSLFLTERDEDRKTYRTILNETIDAIVASFDDGRAYAGKTPYQMQQALASCELLPEQGLGYERTLEELKATILPDFLKTSSTDYLAHLHSPALIEGIAAELILSTFNQSMDSWDQAPIATEVEVAVIEQLLPLFGFDEAGDGIFTSGGSQSNLSALLMAHDWFCETKLHHDVKRRGLPPEYGRLRIYTSELSHFSMEKGAHFLGTIIKVLTNMNVSGLQLSR